MLICIFHQGSGNIATADNVYDKVQLKTIIKACEQKYQIPTGLLAAIAYVESGTRAFAINSGGRAFYTGSFDEAVLFVQRQLKAGRSNIDIGLMQLNWRWHRSSFVAVEDMLKPENNVAYAARLLVSLYRQHGNWQKAIRYYHSAKPDYNIRYSRKVTLRWLSNNS